MSDQQLYITRFTRIFLDSFSARDIVEPLISIDNDKATSYAIDLMNNRDFDAIGIRDKGEIIGYILRDDLGSGMCKSYVREYNENDLVSDSGSFLTVIDLLNEQQRIFVHIFGQVNGIITQDDLQKPPLRMWLFGIITIIEMNFTNTIREYYGNGEWRASISKGRLEKAEALMVERKRRNQPCDIIDCLQFSDKGEILIKDDVTRKQLGIKSRKAGRKAIKGLEALRNSLAHSQDIITYDWNTIVMLASRIEEIHANSKK